MACCYLAALYAIVRGLVGQHAGNVGGRSVVGLCIGYGEQRSDGQRTRDVITIGWYFWCGVFVGRVVPAAIVLFGTGSNLDSAGGFVVDETARRYRRWGVWGRGLELRAKPVRDTAIICATGVLAGPIGARLWLSATIGNRRCVA
jgi:hypothetical protein